MIGIYCFTNNINGKKYIGQSVNIQQRFREHKSKYKNKDNKTKFYYALRKYGFANFSFDIIEETSKEQLDARETYWINYYNSYNNGYNSTETSESVIKKGEEHPNAILKNEDVLTIKLLLKNSNLTQTKIAQQFNISPDIVSSINLGKRWILIGKYNYPIRRTSNGNGVNSLFTDEEILFIRKRYVKESNKKIFEDYKNVCAYSTFLNILQGTRYIHLPIYKKREKKWILEGKEIDFYG